ncbi:MAG TPA: hypothetical protein VM779_07635 [Thermoanaerobaculia bacterium]|nr:hypothetical protein [Thermoanaerobaculia bacterium]
MSNHVDNADFGHCTECGDKFELQNITQDEAEAKAKQVTERGGTCDRCHEGSTPFDEQARHQILQWLGPIEYRNKIAKVIEPQNASYTVVTLKDGRSAKIFRYGESSRQLPEEIDHVFTRSFPDLKRIEKPWKK